MKRLKMQLSDLIAAGISYYNFQRVKNANGVKGWSYILDKSLTDEQYNIILKYRNTLVKTVQHRYAPEVKRQALILFDKCI